MLFLIEHATELVSAVLVLVSAEIAVLIALAILRRRRREMYFRRLDHLRARYRPVVSALLSGEWEYARGLAELESVGGPDRQSMLEQLCLECSPSPAQLPTLGRLAEDLGLVRHWQRQLANRFEPIPLREALARPDALFQWVGCLHFLLRARAAESLGLIRHQPSWPLLLEALDDPHKDVQEVALRSLAALREPRSFLPLVGRLQELALEPSARLSLRSFKAAMAGFPLRCAADLLGPLRHEHPRVRFVAADVLREMVERASAGDQDFSLPPETLPAGLSETLLTQLPRDVSPDVRARAAFILGALREPPAAAALLALLEDPEWFVRLHAVRTLARGRFRLHAPAIAALLTDPHWKVREAAAQTLLALGQVGTQQLFARFLESYDSYGRERIADVMQRAGVIPSLLARYAQTDEGHEARVIARMADMGKTSYLVAVLSASPDPALVRKFLQEFGRHSDPLLRQWVGQFATPAAAPEVRAVAKQQTAPKAREMAA